MARNVSVTKRKPVKQSSGGYTNREWKRLNEQDAREKRRQLKLFMITLLLAVLTLLLLYFVYYVVFRTHDYRIGLAYDKNSTVYGFPSVNSREGTADGFASNLCVIDSDKNTAEVSMTGQSAALMDLSNNQVMYAKDIFRMRDPASLTKIMTCIVALKYGNLDDMVIVNETALDIEYGSSVCDIRVGDRLSMKQLLYGMMVASGNDAAMMIAEHVGGTVAQFVNMMNDEALRLGATRTHFLNPHGLTEEEHYTCVYDLYLIFNEAMKYDTFLDIINRKNFYAEYTDGNGNPTAVTWETTNHYFTGDAISPEDVIIYGGKTGTTDEAGACLALLTKDLYGNPYLAIIMHAENKEYLYQDMNRMLGLITA